MIISPLSSKGIDVCRTILCMQIVFFHMVTTAPVPQEALANETGYGYVIKFVTMMNNLAVPMFYAISGYLFAITYQGTWQNYALQVRKRVTRLLQPMVLWTSLFLVFYYMAQAIPATAPLFSGANKLIAHYDWTDVLDAYAGIKSGFPFAGQYWFLRNLFIACLCYPLIAWFFKHTRRRGFILLAIGCYALRFVNQYIADTIFFFSLGAYLTMDKEAVTYVSKKAGVFALLFAGITMAAFVGYTTLSLCRIYECLFYFFVLTGFITIGKAVRYLLEKGCGNKILLLSGGSFFVFLIHLQLLMLLKRVAYKVLPIHSAAGVLVLFVVIPVIVITLSYLLYFFLKKWTPEFLDVMTGKTGLCSSISKKKRQ